MKKATALILGTTALISAATGPADAQYITWKQNGTPTFIFRNGNGLTPGDEITFTLSVEERNMAIGIPNPCGYKIVNPGKNANSIESIQGNTGNPIQVSSLPTFEGTCKTDVNGNQLKATQEGGTIPTSHYKTPDGKVGVKVEPGWTYLTIRRQGVSKKTKVGKCGEVRYSVQTPKQGERQPFWDGTITIPGVVTNSNLEDIAQDNKIGICSTQWVKNSNNVIEKVARFLTL